MLEKHCIESELDRRHRSMSNMSVEPTARVVKSYYIESAYLRRMLIKRSAVGKQKPSRRDSGFNVRDIPYPGVVLAEKSHRWSKTISQHVNELGWLAKAREQRPAPSAELHNTGDDVMPRPT